MLNLLDVNFFTPEVPLELGSLQDYNSFNYYC